MVEAGPERIAGLGIPASRAGSLAEPARVVAEGGVTLEPGGDVEATMARLERISGIGPWTARDTALRALHWPDAFPDRDLGVRALGGVSAAEARRAAEPWRPWRACATLHLWCVEGPTRSPAERTS